MRVIATTLALMLSLDAGVALATKNDVMPAPHKAPRVPVQQLTLYEPSAKYEPPPKPAASKPLSLKPGGAKSDLKESSLKESKQGEPKEFEGIAKALDGERLLIGAQEIRLFGIVTPGISSNYGPQARQRLDQIIKGAVLCKVTDKDRDGRPIAFCGTVDTPDLSYEMLRQGWAMVDRKALKNNSLAEVYEKVEQEAQSLNKGLFAPMPMVNSVPLSNPANTVTVPLVPPSSTQNEGLKVAEKQSDAKPENSSSENSKTETIINNDLPRTALILPVANRPGSAASGQEPPKPTVKNETAKPVTIAAAQEPGAQSTGFLERYQGIIGGFLWIMGAFVFGGVAILRDRLQQIEKRRSLAAALNGELTAARHICRTRARELLRQSRLSDVEVQPRPSQLWPRIRAIVYQAHVGSIGLLGSDLARRVASVYGQCADYATYYQQTTMHRLPSMSAVSETLSNLADHMDAIIEGLAQVEQTGQPYIPDMIEEPIAADDAGEETDNPQDTQDTKEDQQTRLSVNEEARIIKERFERMAASMMGMLGRKRETTNDLAAIATQDGLQGNDPAQSQSTPNDTGTNLPSQAA